jgi:trigger factor
MKILKQTRVGNLITLEIEEDPAKLKEAAEKTMERLSRRVKMPGFRPGKAPKSLVEKSFDKEAVADQAAQDLIADLYPEIIKQAKIDPVDYPKVDIIKQEEGQPLVFKLEVPVYPEVKLGKYKDLKVKKKPTRVSEEEVLAVLGNLQNRFAKRIEITDRGAQKGDTLDIEIGADSAGAPIKRWPRKLQFLPLGAGHISPEFDAQLIGMKAGESKNFTLKFAGNYGVKEIAGKEVNFKVKLDKLTARELSPLNDEFAMKVSRYGTLAELKEELRKSLEEEKKEESEADLKNRIIEEASKAAEVELPEALVRVETDIMLDELKSSLARSNLSLDDYLKGIRKSGEELRSEFKTPALSRAKGKVVLKRVSELENITVTPQDLDEELKLIAKSVNVPAEQYQKSLSHAGRHYIEDYLLRRKALDFLVKNAQIEESLGLARDKEEKK